MDTYTPDVQSPSVVPPLIPLDAYHAFLKDSYGQNFLNPFQQPLMSEVWNHMRNYYPYLGLQNQQDTLQGLEPRNNGQVKSELNEVGDSSETDDQSVSDEGRCDDDEDSVGSAGGGSRAQYVSANCVVFTHYTGDVASVVDQHFSRALSYSQDKASPGCDKECSPMSARNFPPSFWNQSSVSVSHGHSHSELYGDSMYHGASAHTAADPWHSHYQQYTAAAHHHRAVHDYHHHHHQHMAGYGGLLLPPSSRLPPHPQYPKAVEWNHRLHHDQPAHHLDPASSYASYPTMAGLDGSVQEPSKDLYWF